LVSSQLSLIENVYFEFELRVIVERSS
jgi:hypothetical protein